jgi:hypothetical protein
MKASSYSVTLGAPARFLEARALLRQITEQM